MKKRILSLVLATCMVVPTVVVTGNGGACVMSFQAAVIKKNQRLFTNSGCASMGYGFPAAIGACVARKGERVICIDGDGSFQMNIQELMTCVDYNLNVKVFIINNNYLGMVRQWQEKLYNKHYSQTHISSPDYVKLAEAYGALGIRVEKEEEIEPAIRKAIDHQGPVFVDFVVESFEMVYPWVLAGEPISNVLLPTDYKDEP